MKVTLELLKRLVERAEGVAYVEARFHSRVLNEVMVSKGELEEASSVSYGGVGVRVLSEGAWGFSSTSPTSFEDIVKTLEDSVKITKVSSEGKSVKIERLGEARLAVGRFQPSVNDPLNNHSLEEKVRLVRSVEAAVRSHSRDVKAGSCMYREILDHKLIVTSDGVFAEIYDSKPEFRVTAIASRSGDLVSASETVGVTGGWRDLFDGERSPEALARKAAETACRLLEAKQPKGERAMVILDPAIVGLIAHEAIGHNVEADSIVSGSAFEGKIGEMVAAESVTLVDSGSSELADGAAGSIAVDDEGVLTHRIVIIEHGRLASYLHSRETAYSFDVESTGNARAFEYSDEPKVRMRNTFITPGDYDFEEMVHEVSHGYLLKGPRGGQADSNTEFMFGAQEAYLIERGEVKELLRGVSVSGNAVEVLRSVDAVGRDFAYGIGAGYCGKWQPMKVDAGGPHVRCRAVIGGLQTG